MDKYTHCDKAVDSMLYKPVRVSRRGAVAASKPRRTGDMRMGELVGISSKQKMPQSAMQSVYYRRRCARD
ncbi:unnamed protein product [Pieris macdunnoughi]|uniref:Uncharacterized protein n=1 Tax=Pieris macdunnoughi TaxID=345717 RepID=A0A821Y6G1_9NEOP|nr:unnamed protein product [Pieris macdunnoughi]